MIDYGSPAGRNIRFTRVGDRRASSPPVVVAKDSAAAVPGALSAATQAPQMEYLTGEYEVVPGRTITVTLENGQLHGALTGGAKLPLLHSSGATLAVGRPDAPVTPTFELDG
jgi:hypothetical protein